MDFATWLITSPWQCCLMTSVIQALNRTAGPRKHLRQPIRMTLRQPIGPGALQTRHRSVSMLMDVPLFCVIGRTTVQALSVLTQRAPADNNRTTMLSKYENTVRIWVLLSGSLCLSLSVQHYIQISLHLQIYNVQCCYNSVVIYVFFCSTSMRLIPFIL